MSSSADLDETISMYTLTPYCVLRLMSLMRDLVAFNWLRSGRKRGLFTGEGPGGEVKSGNCASPEIPNAHINCWECIHHCPYRYWVSSVLNSAESPRGMSDQASGNRSCPDKVNDNAKKRKRNTISCFQVSWPFRRFRFLFMHTCTSYHTHEATRIA